MGNYVILPLAPTITELDEFSEGLFVHILCVRAGDHTNAIPLVVDIRHED
jgi:hypothetical protein